MIISIAGIKGGTGKTTIATNLIAYAASTGKKCLLVDGDEQKSAYNWSSQRNSNNIETDWTTVQLTGKGIYTEIKKLHSNYDLIIIDVGGRDTSSLRAALSVSHKSIFPFRPRSYDIWTIKDVKDLIEEIKSINQSLEVYMVINQADSRGSDNDEAISILSEIKEYVCIKNTIGYRKAFSNAAALGLSVFELKEKKDINAIQEIEWLYEWIFSGSDLIQKDAKIKQKRRVLKSKKT